ncbi:MAG: hypothetical protein QM733_04240 [Ilumatobacteraceae bacterium]
MNHLRPRWPRGRLARVAAPLLAVAVTLAACGSDTKSSSTTAAGSTTTTAASLDVGRFVGLDWVPAERARLPTVSSRR